jgi:hypothetical protein
VVRFALPNLHALNFLLHGALDGGGTLSLKTDAQGKVYSTALLRLVIEVPDAEAASVGAPGQPGFCACASRSWRWGLWRSRSLSRRSVSGCDGWGSAWWGSP